MTLGTPPYDAIGRNYSRYRSPEPRIQRAIHAALGGATRVLNVGAGTGSYEPTDRVVVAVEPSGEMIGQRPAGSAPVVRASAESLPFVTGSFDASLAILTLHHWLDYRAGLREMRRVARDRVVLLTWDPAHPGFWLVRDYFPDILQIDRRIFPSLGEVESILGRLRVLAVPIPHDCADGFLGAYWRRPSAYLDAGVRSAISTFARVDEIEPGLARLQANLRSGEWAVRNAALLGVDELDLGYRLVIAAGGPDPR